MARIGVAFATLDPRCYGCGVSTCPTCHKAFDKAAFCPQDGTRLVDPTGDVVLDNRYRLIRQVGAGGMGEVYEAVHVHLARKVAVKILKPEIASDLDAIARLKQEAQTTSGLGHPNIVHTLDFGQVDGQSYLVMEWLDGENLDQRLGRGLIDLATALEIAVQTAAGLVEAHAHGVIHRDIKPANLFLTTDRHGGLLVKIVDFGIAKLAASRVALTATGVLIGSPSYMAPEQALGEVVDGRTDVYALGVILYEMVTGAPPFRGDTPLAVLHQHTSKAPIRPSESAVDRGIFPELETLILRCLAKRPDERFASMRELGEALDAMRSLGSGVRPAASSSSATPAQLAQTILPASALAAPPNVPDTASMMTSSNDAPSTPSPIARFDDAPIVVPRRRWPLFGALAVVLAGAVVAAIVLVGRDDGRAMATAIDAQGSDGAIVALSTDAPGVDTMTIVDARVVDATVAAADAKAASADASIPEPADAVVVAWRQELRGRTLTAVATSPTPPTAGQPFELTLEISTVRAAAANRARLQLHYFRDHSTVHSSVHELAASSVFTVTILNPRSGKHHVELEILDGERLLDVAKTDLTVAP